MARLHHPDKILNRITEAYDVAAGDRCRAARCSRLTDVIHQRPRLVAADGDRWVRCPYSPASWARPTTVVRFASGSSTVPSDPMTGAIDRNHPLHTLGGYAEIVRLGIEIDR